MMKESIAAPPLQEIQLNDLESGVHDSGPSSPSLSKAASSALHQPPTPVRLHIISLSYSVLVKQPTSGKVCARSKKEETTLLHKITTSFLPGTLTAIMGPSGAGKTTLLSCILGEAAGRTDGVVKVNGRPLHDVARQFKNFVTLVPQDDTLLSSLTPLETLTFAARLRLPPSMSKDAKADRVQMILSDLSLLDCAKVPIGNVDKRGISGGERKRVSIGLELLVNPSVMALDEPTSGQDSKTSEDIVDRLSWLAGQGRTMLVNIHAPSWRNFERFDHVILLAKGKMIFAGPTSEVEKYFGGLGYVTPKGINPMDHILRVIQTEALSPMEGTTSTIKEGKDVEAKEESLSAGGEEGEALINQERLPDIGLAICPERANGMEQFTVLLHRFFLDSFKDKEKAIAGIGLKLSTGILVGIVWLKQAGTNQNTIFPVTSALFLTSCSSVLDTLFGTIMTLPTVKTLLKREYRNNYYNLFPYFAAMLLSTLVINIMYALAMATPIYLLIGIATCFGDYLAFLSILALLCAMGAILGLAIGCNVSDIQGAQQAAMPSVLPLLLFSGFLIPYSLIPIYFKWVYWISPFAHGINALEIIIFRGIKFTDCSPERAATGACFMTGRDYLRSVHADPAFLGRDIGLMFAAIAVLMIFCYRCFRGLVRAK